jgi:vacuolar-type H+-ATPase subunit I/STV1
MHNVIFRTVSAIYSLNSYMNTIRIDILNPKAKKLLKNLEELNLISIKKDEELSFSELVDKLRNKAEPKPSFEEITKEVEEVRAKRYAKKKGL